MASHGHGGAGGHGHARRSAAAEFSYMFGRDWPSFLCKISEAAIRADSAPCRCRTRLEVDLLGQSRRHLLVLLPVPLSATYGHSRSNMHPYLITPAPRQLSRAASCTQLDSHAQFGAPRRPITQVIIYISREDDRDTVGRYHLQGSTGSEEDAAHGARHALGKRCAGNSRRDRCRGAGSRPPHTIGRP